MLSSTNRVLITVAILGAVSARSAHTQQTGTDSASRGRPARAQTPKPPFPYQTEDVVFASVQGVRIAATVTRPAGDGPFPAVVLVSGSGPHDRGGGGAWYTPHWVIADHLARHGVASLRYDKRGHAQSTGNFATSTVADFADDAEAAVRFLRARRRIDQDQVGIAGHSEGGLVAPMVAARAPEVAFIIILGAPGVPGDSLMMLQRIAINRVRGIDPETDIELAANRQAFAAMRAARDSADMATRLTALGEEFIAQRPPAEQADWRRRIVQGRAQFLSPWWRHLGFYDPRPALRRVQVPVLALTGALDVQVPHEPNLAGIAAALQAGGNRDFHIVAVPGLNHLLQTARTGDPEEYDQLPDIVSPVVLELITNWILAHTRRP